MCTASVITVQWNHRTNVNLNHKLEIPNKNYICRYKNKENILTGQNTKINITSVTINPQGATLTYQVILYFYVINVF